MPKKIDREAAIREASAAFLSDLRELKKAGAGKPFAEYLSKLPDPDTDDVEHD